MYLVSFAIILSIRPGSKKILFTALMTCEAAGGGGEKNKNEKK